MVGGGTGLPPVLAAAPPASVVLLGGQGDAGRGHWRGTPASFDCLESFLSLFAPLVGVSSRLGSVRGGSGGGGLDSKGRGG